MRCRYNAIAQENLQLRTHALEGAVVGRGSPMLDRPPRNSGTLSFYVFARVIANNVTVCAMLVRHAAGFEGTGRHSITATFHQAIHAPMPRNG